MRALAAVERMRAETCQRRTVSSSLVCSLNHPRYHCRDFRKGSHHGPGPVWYCHSETTPLLLRTCESLSNAAEHWHLGARPRKEREDLWLSWRSCGDYCRHRANRSKAARQSAAAGLRGHGRTLGAGSLIEEAAQPRESGPLEPWARAGGKGGGAPPFYPWGMFPPYMVFL